VFLAVGTDEERLVLFEELVRAGDIIRLLLNERILSDHLLPFPVAHVPKVTGKTGMRAVDVVVPQGDRDPVPCPVTNPDKDTRILLALSVQVKDGGIHFTRCPGDCFL